MSDLNETIENEVAPLSVTLKISGGTNITVNLNKKMSVYEAKQATEPLCEISPDNQRFIYKGRILKDEDKLGDLGLASGHIIHLVKKPGALTTPGKTSDNATPINTTETTPNPLTSPIASGGFNPTSAPTPSSAGMPGMSNLAGVPGMPNLAGMPGMPNLAGVPGMPNLAGMPGMPNLAGMPGMPDAATLRAVMDNPMVQNAVQQVMSNPEMMRALVQSNPMIRQAAQQDPFLRNVLDNPEMLQSFLTPEAMRTASQAGSLIGDRGTGGFDPNSAAEMFRMSADLVQRNPELLRSFMGGMGSGNAAAGVNPFLASMMGSGGAGVADTRPPVERFRIQLDRLVEMGFIDRDANIQALTETNGDVDASITLLLDRGLGN